MSHNKSKQQPFHLRWRLLVLSKHGPSAAMTRLILCALHRWMDAEGKCFPSINRISLDTRCSEKTVRTHLTKANHEGWLLRYIRQTHGGKRWKNYIYQAAIPRAAVRATGQMDGAVVDTVVPVVDTGEVRYLLPTNYSMNYSTNSSFTKLGSCPKYEQPPQRIKKRIPDDMNLTPALRSWCLDIYPRIDPDARFEAFKFDAISKGHQREDWHAAFKAYIHNGPDHTKGNSSRLSAVEIVNQQNPLTHDDEPGGRTYEHDETF